jgi:hypothetical protein
MAAPRDPDLTRQAQLSPKPLPVGKVHGQQSLEGREPPARRRCPTPIAFKLRDDLTLTCDAFLGFDDVPFNFCQMFLPDGVVHRTSATSIDVNEGPCRRTATPVSDLKPSSARPSYSRHTDCSSPAHPDHLGCADA